MLLRDKIIKQMNEHLEKGEELLSVGGFKKRPSYAAVYFSGGLDVFARKHFHIGVTNKRIIILPLKWPNNHPEIELKFDVSFDGLEIKGNKLVLNSPLIDKPLKLHFLFGINAITGLNRDEFVGAVFHGKQI